MKKKTSKIPDKVQLLGIVGTSKALTERLSKYRHYYGECGKYGFSFCRLWAGVYNVSLVYAPFHLRLSIPETKCKSKAISDFICESESIAWKLEAHDIRINADVQMLYDYLMADDDAL